MLIKIVVAGIVFLVVCGIAFMGSLIADNEKWGEFENDQQDRWYKKYKL